MAEPIRIHKVIRADGEKVFQAMTRGEDLIHWFRGTNEWITPYADSDAVPKGRLKVGFADAEGKNSFDFAATYTRVDREHIEYTLDDGRRVKIEIRPSVEAISEVFWEFEAEQSHSRELQQAGWQNMLDNLAEYLERGPRE